MLTFHKRRSASTLATVAGIAVLVSGCATTELGAPPDNGHLRDIDRAVLVSPNVEITVDNNRGEIPERIVPEQVFDPGRHLMAVPQVEHVNKSESFENFYAGNTAEVPARFGQGIPFYISGEWAETYNYFIIPESPVARAGWDLSGVWVTDRKYRLGDGKTVGPQELHAEKIRLRPGDRMDYAVCPSRTAMEQGGDACKKGSVEAEAWVNPYRVRVHVEGRERALYGLLAFFPVVSSAQGSASRIYRIEVPQQYIDSARSGNVSVVYQPYSHPFTNWSTRQTTKQKRVSWALWMSDIPFY